MKNSERIGIRQYNKSELPRLRWTPQLHQHFLEAVQSLGGKQKATPKQILQQMRVKGLRIAHIKSHLQMCRNRKGLAILEPGDHLLEENANHLKNCSSSCSTERSIGTTLRVSKCESRTVKQQEFHLLDSKKGLSQTSEETEYDLNQEPESSNACLHSDDLSTNEEENCGIIKSSGLSLISYSTPLTSMLHGESGQEIMRFSSSTAPHNHSVDSSSITSIPALGNNYINLDLTI